MPASKPVNFSFPSTGSLAAWNRQRRANVLSHGELARRLLQLHASASTTKLREAGLRPFESAEPIDIEDAS